MSDIHDAETAPRSADHKGLFATLGLAGAFLASACCIVPLVLVTLGISGAWIGNLTALEPYKPLTSGIAIVFIGLGFWHVYFRTNPYAWRGRTAPARNRRASPKRCFGRQQCWSCCP